MIRLLLALLLYPAASMAQRTPTDERGFELVASSFVAIQTGDASAAAAWYERVFDVREVRRIDTADGALTIRILSDDVLTIELIQARGAPPPPPRHLGFFKAGLYVDGIDAAHRWMIRQGVDTDDAVFVDEALGARSFVFRDGEGNRLQLFERCAASCS